MEQAGRPLDNLFDYDIRPMLPPEDTVLEALSSHSVTPVKLFKPYTIPGIHSTQSQSSEARPTSVKGIKTLRSEADEEEDAGTVSAYTKPILNKRKKK